MSPLGPSRVCLRKASKTETMMTVSRVSRKTTRKTGTAKTSTAMLTVDSVSVVQLSHLGESCLKLKYKVIQSSEKYEIVKERVW